MISQMHWIITHFDNRNTKKVIYCFYAIFSWFSPLLEENGYKCCLNTLNPSLTHIICQMLWIVTNILP
ncbi:hypothetical protein AtEden1_Chr1g0041401 [Arabidopsis thaliana]